jgi:hypothetical protein
VVKIAQSVLSGLGVIQSRDRELWSAGNEFMGVVGCIGVGLCVGFCFLAGLLAQEYAADTRRWLT